MIELTAALTGRLLDKVLMIGACRGGTARSASRPDFLAILDSGLSAVTVAGAALRLATTLLRGSGRLGAARRGAAFGLGAFFNLLVLVPGFLPGIAALLTSPVI
ncbi:MAG: hypothetical protein ACHQDB_09105 [Steroidobacterales bacterium]